MCLRFRSGRAVLIATLLLVISAGATAQEPLRLLTVDRDSNLLSVIDPISGITVSTVLIDLPGQQVLSATGLATDPTSGTLYALLQLGSGGNVRRLVTLDPATGAATNIGPADDGTGLLFSDITFSANGVLYGVTSDDEGIGAPSPDSLFILNKTTGDATLVRALGNGDTGESIAFNPEDNFLYHASGFFDVVFEKIDPGLPIPPINIPLSLEAPSEATSLLHLRGDFFLWTNFFQELFLVNRNGSVRFLTLLDHVPTGLALTGSPAPCPPNAALYGSAFQGQDGPAMLFSLNPATGAANLVGPIGLERVSGIGFRSDGTLFGVGERMDGSNTTVLSTIDPCSGLATEVGVTGMQDFTDLSVQPSSGVLYGILEDASQQSMRLATLNTDTGEATSVGLTNTFGLGNGIGFSPAGELFHADELFLSTLSPQNASILTEAPLTFVPPPDVEGFLEVNALDFQPGTGTLFGVRNDSDGSFLTTVDTTDPTTPVMTNVGGTQAGLDGIAFARSNVAPATANLTITNADDADPISAGNTITYTIVVTNNGPDAAQGVVLSDQLPAVMRNASAVSTQGGCSQGIHVLCDLGTISSGASVTVTVSATVVVSASGSINNTATVGSASTDPVPGNNSASASTTILAAPAADLEVSSFGHLAGAVAVGGQISFTATARNNGGVSADAKLSFLFPVRMSSLNTLADCVNQGTTVTCDLGMLDPAESATVTITVAPPFVRSIRPVANVMSAFANDTNGTNNTRAADTAVQVRPRPLAREGLEIRIP